MSGWVAPTVAIALVFIAAAFVAVAIALVLLGTRVARETENLARQVSELHAELTPTVASLRRLTTSGEELAGKMRSEILAVLRTSRRVRRGVNRGVRQVRHHLAELDALYEVVHDEVEDTALQVAATLRSVRGGAGALTRIRRLLRRGRR